MGLVTGGFFFDGAYDGNRETLDHSQKNRERILKFLQIIPDLSTRDGAIFLCKI